MVVEDILSLFSYGQPDIADGCGFKSGLLCSFDAAAGGYGTSFFGSAMLAAIAVLLRPAAIRLRHRTSALVFNQDKITFHKSFGIDVPIPLSDFSMLRLNFDPNQEEKKTEYWSFCASSDLLSLSVTKPSGQRKHYNISANEIDGGRIALSKFISAVNEQR